MSTVLEEGFVVCWHENGDTLTIYSQDMQNRGHRHLLFTTVEEALATIRREDVLHVLYKQAKVRFIKRLEPEKDQHYYYYQHSPTLDCDGEIRCLNINDEYFRIFHYPERYLWQYETTLNGVDHVTISKERIIATWTVQRNGEIIASCKFVTPGSDIFCVISEDYHVVSVRYFIVASDLVVPYEFVNETGHSYHAYKIQNGVVTYEKTGWFVRLLWMLGAWNLFDKQYFDWMCFLWVITALPLFLVFGPALCALGQTEENAQFLFVLSLVNFVPILSILWNWFLFVCRFFCYTPIPLPNDLPADIAEAFAHPMLSRFKNKA